jgi:endogenous inhibitor of DNA gyrase (YacG/DUF329 family)
MTPPDSSDPKPLGARLCPICGRPATPRHRPFCSARCADIDLGRWLKGGYRIPTEEPSEAGEEKER